MRRTVAVTLPGAGNPVSTLLGPITPDRSPGFAAHQNLHSVHQIVGQCHRSHVLKVHLDP